MRLKYPLPEIEEVRDEEDDPRILEVEKTVPSMTMRRNVNAVAAAERMKGLLKAGMGKRAVVVGKYVADKFNPVNWGIVVDVHPFNTWPLEVRFVSTSQTALSDGSDLEVIYREMSATDLAEYLKPRHMQ